MQIANKRSLLTIIASAMLGGAYSFFAAISLRGANASLWKMTLSAVFAAALCACAGSALCRYFAVCQRIRRNQKRLLTIQQRQVDKSRRETVSRNPDYSWSEQNVSQCLGCAPPQSQSFELLICQGVQSGEEQMHVRRRRMTKNDLNQYLKCLLEGSVLE
jgi:hypothetical protein